jgi:MSHA biogenesis protein MshL
MMDSLKRISKICILLFPMVITLLLSSCHTVKSKDMTSIEQMNATLKESIRIDHGTSRRTTRLPSAVSEALLPSISSRASVDDEPSEHRFDITADKIPAKTFFMGLVEGTPYNMMVNPNVQGTISLNLKKVTLEEAMDAVRDMYGYDYRQTSYGYEVLPPELETELFNVNYLDVKRTGKSTTEMTSGQVSDVGTINVGGTSGTGGSLPAATANGQASVSSSSVDTSSEMNFWHDLKGALTDIVGKGKDRVIVVNPQAGVVIIHAYPAELHQVARYLDRIQSNLQRQVIIEAKILEVQLSDDFQAGIDWSLLGNPLDHEALLSQAGNGPHVAGVSGAGAIADVSSSDIQNFASIFTITTKGSFRTLLRFLQTQGNVQALSNPHISTVNNQKAVIKVGQDEFFVTGVSTSNTIIGTNTLPSQNVSLTPFFSGVTLDVTPQISRDGSVILHIHPSVSEVREQEKNITIGSTTGSTPNTLSLPLALSTIRESDNIVRAKNGQVIVIGGLMQNNMKEEIAGTPGLSHIPFVGAFFRRTSQKSQKSELVILLRPILVENHAWLKQLRRNSHDFHSLKKGFHVGGLPNVFGTEGERESEQRRDYDTT